MAALTVNNFFRGMKLLHSKKQNISQNRSRRGFWYSLNTCNPCVPCNPCNPCDSSKSAKRGGSDGNTMEAVVFDGEKLSVKYHPDFPKPQIKSPNDVLVKIEYAGVCGTDVHIIKGNFPARKSPPYPLGHESAGVIEAVGDKCVFKPGQKVAIYPSSPCDLCDFCRLGTYQHCLVGGLNNYIGIFKEGGWAQYLIVPQQQVYVLPKGLTTKQAALAEPISCVVHTFNRASPMRIGQELLVLGAGIIGNLFSSGVHYQGHRSVTICEMNPKRLQLAEQLETGFRLIKPDVLKKEKKLYDIIIDCTGVAAVMETCFDYIQRGGKYVVFGCCPPNSNCKLIPYQFFDKELTIVGAKMNPYTFVTAIKWIQCMGDRYVDYERLGVKEFKLKEYESALKELQAGTISKAMFKIGS